MNSSQQDKPPERDGAKKKRRRRRRKGPPHDPTSAAHVLAKKTKKLDVEKSADAPLTQDEVATLRQHFGFLRQHRKVLRLRVNAAEDLLLNGVQEPTHRGVCQHLLAKVDRASVMSAAERLEPAAAAELLGGIIRFAPEIEYVLLFLEKVRLSSSQAEATAALSQGLQRIDFSKVSSAQMRRVLDLFAELFDDKQRPQLLLGLLESPSFRKAFDSSIADLPEPLARFVVPLRAAQAAVLHGKSNTFGADRLRQGVRLLFEVGDDFLLHLPPEIRRRLVTFGMQACCPPEHTFHQSLDKLLKSLPTSERQHRELGISFARHLLASDEDKEAGKLLKALATAHPDFNLPGRWLDLLKAPRIDRFALLDKPKHAHDALQQHRRISAVWLMTMRPAWIQIASDEHVDTHHATEKLLKEICIPSVAPFLLSGTTPDGASYFAVPNPGQPLERALTHKGGLSLGSAIRMCREAAGIFSALASAGIALPDAHSQRFALASNGQLWLVDLSGGRRCEAKEASAAHLPSIRKLCEHVLQHASRYLPPHDLLRALETSTDCVELALTLESLS